MHTAMVISPHADDVAAFCGGTIARLADEGSKVVLVRVTDDCRDSVGLTLEETARRNAEELRSAAKILGVAVIEELGFETHAVASLSITRSKDSRSRSSVTGLPGVPERMFERQVDQTGEDRLS